MLSDCTIFLESGKFTTEKEGNCLRFFALQSVSLDALRIALDNMSESFQTKWQRFANYCKMKEKELLTSEFCKLVIRSRIFFYNSNEIFIYSERCFIAKILLLHCTCT